MKPGSKACTRRAWSPASLGVLAALAGGCGGGPEPYALASTVECLERFAIVRLDRNGLDPIALEADQGAFELETGSGVTISFGPSEDEGRRTEEAYRDALRPIVRVPLDDLLDRRGNAVFRWELAPTAYEREAIIGCLRTGAQAGDRESVLAAPTAQERAMTRRVNTVLGSLSFEALKRLGARARAALGALTIMNGDGLVSRDEIPQARKYLAILQGALSSER